MKKTIISFYLFLSMSIFGQNRDLNIGANNSGICFGNSKIHNGLRLNLWDKNVD